MRRQPLFFAGLLLGLAVPPAIAATTYRVNLNFGYDVTQGSPLQHAASFPIGASNGTAVFTGSGFAYPGHVGCHDRADMTWTSGFSGGCSAEVLCANRVEDFVISGPPGPPVPGSLHFRVQASFGRLGGFAGNGGHRSVVFVRVSVNGIVATGDYSVGNGGSSSSGLLAGLSGDNIDRSFDITGNFPVGTPFAVEMSIQEDAYCYGNVFNTNPGFTEASAGDGSSPGGGGGGLRLQESSGVVMTLPAGYTLNSVLWGITDSHYTSLVAVEPATPRSDFALAAEPNPSAATVTLRYTQPREGVVAIDVFDASGRCVRRIADGWSPAGESVATWDGRGAGGARVPAGIYFARFEGVGCSVTRRIVRME
jgi:hypothetical protein